MKIIKKLSIFTLAFVLILSNLGSVSAYDENVTIDSRIVINYTIGAGEEGAGSYVTLKSGLNTDDAKVYNQEIQLTKADYDKIIAAENEIEKYYKTEWVEKLSKMDNTTEEYTTALATYNAKMAELEDSKKALIPIYDNSKWNELKKVNSTDSESRYGASVTGDNAFFIAWVKVTVNGTDYYNYDFGCIEDEPETPKNPVCKYEDGKYYDDKGTEVTKEKYEEACVKKICRIENGKYYDKDGNEVSKDAYYKACPNPKTGRNVYYTYGIITVIGAFILYMFTRRIKKFSR